MAHHNFSMYRLLRVSMSRYRRTNEKNQCRRLSLVSTIIRHRRRYLRREQKSSRPRSGCTDPGESVGIQKVVLCPGGSCFTMQHNPLPPPRSVAGRRRCRRTGCTAGRRCSTRIADHAPSHLMSFKSGHCPSRSTIPRQLTRVPAPHGSERTARHGVCYDSEARAAVTSESLARL